MISGPLCLPDEIANRAMTAGAAEVECLSTRRLNFTSKAESLATFVL